MKQTLTILLLMTLYYASVAETASVANKAKMISLTESEIQYEWAAFKAKNGRSFRSSLTETKKYGVFKENLKKINEQNEKYNNRTSTYAYGINQFSDMSSEEFMAYVNKGINTEQMFKTLSNVSTAYKTNRLTVSLPASVDWRTQGFISAIKEQGQCGCCWAFSAISAIESYYYKTNGQLLSFSEQQLVDCTYKYLGYSGTEADGCQGGFMTVAFDYQKAKGIALANSYPYTSSSSGIFGTCKYTSAMSAAQIASYVTVKNGVANEAAVTDAIANQGPIAVGLFASSAFQHYSSGVFTDTSCPKGSINHAVNLVGYGTLNSQDYYILRNSWGTSWGDKDYMLFRRNNNNQCGIASYASYPVVKSTSGTTQSTQSSTTQSTPKTASTTQSSPKTVSTSQSPTVSSTTQSSPSSKCSKGTGWYANAGCQTAYYCQIRITNLVCSSGYLFDTVSNSCKLANLVQCSALSTQCPNGTGYYTYPGCQKLYFCKKAITDYYCNSGYLFDANTKSCRSKSLVTCSA